MAQTLTLEQQEKILESKITYMFKELQAINADAKLAERNVENFPTFRGKYKELDALYNNFTKAWEKLEEICIILNKEKEFPFEVKFKQHAKLYLYECNTIYENIMNPVPGGRTSLNTAVIGDEDGTSIQERSLARSRLPKINIPSFHGDILKWPQFRDLFLSLVHQEPAITDIEKFHYLVGCVAGEPLQIVTTFPLSADNYAAAWGALYKRFNNKRVLASSYLSRIRQFKPNPRLCNDLSYLRSYLKTVDENFSALKALSIPDEADFLKLNIALEYLDIETRRHFEEKQQGQEFPTYARLIEFIQQRCQVLELSSPMTVAHPSSSNSNPQRSKVLATIEQGASKSTLKQNDRYRYSCPKCKGSHLLFRCFSFNRLPTSQKVDYVIKSQICMNCLKPGHTALRCPSKYSCTLCERKHHTLLHLPTDIDSTSSTLKPEPALTASHPSTSAGTKEGLPSGLVGTTTDYRCVLLGTAIIYMRDWKGDLLPVRAVIDSGSQFSIMTTECAKRLGLTWSPVKRSISGVGCTQTPPAKGSVFCHICPTHKDYKELNTWALVMTAITPHLPSVSLSPSICKYFNSVKLADTKFWEPNPVEFLLGSDLFLQILLPEPGIKVSDNFGTLPTIFGHIVMGSAPDLVSTFGTCLTTVYSAPLTDEILKDFWQIEEPVLSTYSHPDDALCEKHFKETTTRLPSGRYMVALPFRDAAQTYSGSKLLAMKRFRNLESRLDRDATLKQKYDEFMGEYAAMKHMEVTTSDSAFVIPHHPVYKKELGANKEPKFRVVFDASMKTAGRSLNDNLYVGPKLQQDITTIILNFRVHRIAFCTDIVKMFRQILVRPEDRCFQHILWRSSQEDAIKTYELATVTYGLTSSPYLALRVLSQLAEDDGHKYPDAAKVLRRDVYVDDVITGADTLDAALQLKENLIHLLKGGGFEVHKWSSSSPAFLGTIPEEVTASKGLLPKDVTTKVLGMFWDAERDQFYFQVEPPPSEITKRTMLSVIARLFDPLGFVAPLIFLAKSILQQLWLLKLDWDAQPPQEVMKMWTDLLEDLPNVKNIRLPRWIHIRCGRPMILGFCDASQKGYAAAIYLRILEADTKIHCFLIKAKTRLAPVKTISVPRLELCAAHLLTKLVRSIDDFRKTHFIEDMHLFTDSTIVLSWLKISPTDLKTFVANRVGDILTSTDANQWRHISSIENPADIASRGTLTSCLIHNQLWWHGPSWIYSEPMHLRPLPAVLVEVPERKEAPIVAFSTSDSDTTSNLILSKTSSYRRAIAAMAYILRFLKNLRSASCSEKTFGALKVEELDEASNQLVRETQRQFFVSDFNFETKSCLSARFQSLAVFMDKTGLLRVGGRLTHAQLPYEQRHPLLLPTHARYTVLLIDYIHAKNFHLGLAARLAFIQRRYYIFQLRSLVRKRIWRCQRCFRTKAKPDSPFMANLPLSRVSQGRPFIQVGIDFAGPFNIKLSPRRNAPTSKAYLCIFVCMSVKAVHLELVSALSTDAFLAAFDRFIARRGMPTDVYSDCGLNFVGAARHLKELFVWYQTHSTEEDITNHTAQLGIRWHFNPPYSPHFGGLWEAAVKSAKSLLKKTLGDRPFVFEELATIFSRIEAVLNSRPLCTTSAQPHNYDYLTPGHFLIGSALLAPPEKDITEISLNRLSRWQLLQNSVQTFWKRWSNEYIHLLQSRSKWTRKTSPIKLDDIVLLQDPQTSPLKWKMGRVIETHPGRDGVVRVATVKTSTGSFKRAVHKLARLPQDETSE